jgi:hypothetical protein
MEVDVLTHLARALVFGRWTSDSLDVHDAMILCRTPGATSTALVRVATEMEVSDGAKTVLLEAASALRITGEATQSCAK